MSCIFIRIKRIFEGHSGAMIKKIRGCNGENTSCPQSLKRDAAKISHYYVKLFDNIYDIACRPCLILKNFSTHSMLKFK